MKVLRVELGISLFGEGERGKSLARPLILQRVESSNRITNASPLAYWRQVPGPGQFRHPFLDRAPQCVCGFDDLRDAHPPVLGGQFQDGH